MSDSSKTPAPVLAHEACRLAEDHFTVDLMEYVADVNGSGRRRIGGEFWQVDESVTSGPVELVRESDGLRVCVDVEVDVWVKKAGE